MKQPIGLRFFLFLFFSCLSMIAVSKTVRSTGKSCIKPPQWLVFINAKQGRWRSLGGGQYQLTINNSKETQIRVVEDRPFRYIAQVTPAVLLTLLYPDGKESLRRAMAPPRVTVVLPTAAKETFTLLSLTTQHGVLRLVVTGAHRFHLTDCSDCELRSLFVIIDTQRIACTIGIMGCGL